MRNITSEILTNDMLVRSFTVSYTHRRQDLVRFGQFSDGSYVWPWKGGVVDGAAVEEHFDVYPIPSADIGANPSLTQNTGY